MQYGEVAPSFTAFSDLESMHVDAVSMSTSTIGSTAAKDNLLEPLRGVRRYLTRALDKCREAWTQFDVALMRSSSLLSGFGLLAAIGTAAVLSQAKNSWVVGSLGIFVAATAGAAVSVVYSPVDWLAACL